MSDLPDLTYPADLQSILFASFYALTESKHILCQSANNHGSSIGGQIFHALTNS